MTDRPRVVMPLWNNFKNDARVLKEAQSLQDTGYDVTIVCLQTDPDQLRDDILPSGVKIKRISFRRKKGYPLFPTRNIAGKTLHLIRLMTSQLRMVVVLAKLRPSIIHAHDINTLIPAAMAKILARAKLIYDAHEFAPDRVGYQKQRRMICLIETCIIPRVDGMISTSPSNSKAYARLYKCPRPTVLGNMPPQDEIVSSKDNDRNAVRAAWGVPEGRTIILYQGGLQPGRGLDCLLASIPKLHPSGHLVLMGDGRLKDDLLKQASTLGIADRVSWHPPVPLDVLPSYTAAADIGVHPLEDMCRNHRWASPNKLYEYVHAGLPVVMSSLLEPRRILETWGVGQCFTPGDAHSLSTVLNRLLRNDTLRAELAENSRKAARTLTWQSQAQHLIALYKSI